MNYCYNMVEYSALLGFSFIELSNLLKNLILPDMSVHCHLHEVQKLEIGPHYFIPCLHRFLSHVPSTLSDWLFIQLISFGYASHV